VTTEVIPWPVVAENSEAEESLARAFHAADLGPEWLVLHSLNLADGSSRKKWCEADFLIIGPPGLLVLEAKGGSITRRAGRWYSTNRRGAEYSIQDPIEQAKTVAFGMAEAVSLVFPSLRQTLQRALIGFGVAFPDCSWRHSLLELPEQLVIDKDNSKPECMSTFLRAAFNYWERKLGNRVSPLSADERQAIRRALRPDFDLFQSQAVVGERVLAQQARATDEQYAALDLIQGVSRACFEGGAGTGKTFVACEACRRLANEGRRVGLLVHSRALAHMLSATLGESQVSVVLAAELGHVVSPFDVLVVDEGQDLLQPDSLAAIDRVLKDGLDRGRWFWFMDSNRQLLPGTSVSRECLARILAMGGLNGRPLQLRRNCRNSPLVRENAVLCTGYDVGTCSQKGAGGDVSVIAIGAEEEATAKLVEWLNAIGSEGVRLREIAVLTTGRPSWLGPALKAAGKRFACLDIDPKIDTRTYDGLCISSIETFKGLERPYVAFLAPEAADVQMDGRLLYVALTRARVAVCMIVTPELRGRLERSAVTVAEANPSLFGA
jgi:hypothetical protein